MKKLLLTLTVVGMLCARGEAQTTRFWSANGTTQGGAGAWDTTTINRWGTAAAGPFTTAWVNANGDAATFGGTAGAVTLVGPITASQINWTLGGFSLGNGNGVGTAANQINFVGNAGTLNATHTSLTTQLTAFFSGQTITKTGAGRIEINNTANANTNKWVLAGGALTAPAPSRFGTNPAALVTDFFKFDGGGFGGNTTAAYNFQTNWGVTITANGANFGASANTVITNITGPIDAKGDITITGGGVFTGSGHTAGGILMLSNTGNAWTGVAGGGTINISGTSGSGLRLGASNVVPDQYTVNLTVAGTFMDLATNTASETVKAVKGTAGTVQVGDATLTIADGNDASGTASTFSSVFTSTAAGKVIKNGAGTQILSGGSAGFLGEMILNAGTFGVGGTGAFGSGVGAQLTINGGKLANTAAAGRSMSANLSVNLNGDFTVDESLFSGPGQILFQGTNTIKNSNRTITVDGNANLAFGTLTVGIGEDVAGRSLTKAGTGTLALLSPVNTYSGNTTINAGILSVDGDGSLGNQAGTLILNGGAFNASASRTVPTANPVNVTANSSITTTSAATTVAFEFSSNTFGGNGTSTLTFRNNGADAAGDQFEPRLSGSGFDFTNPIAIENGTTGKTQLQSNNAAGTQTFSGVLSGTGGYDRTQNGTTVFTAANTYGGPTNIRAGVVQLSGGANRLPTGTTVSMGGAGAGLGTFDLNGQNQEIAGLVSTVGTNATANNNTVTSATPATLTFSGSSNYVYGAGTDANSGVITGAIAVVKNGTGSQTLGDDNTYDGGTIINDGKVYANNTSGSALGSGPVQVNGSMTTAGVLGGTGSVSGAVTVNGGGALSPGTSIDSLDVGALTFDNTGTNPIFAFEINSSLGIADLLNAASLTFNGATTLAISDLAGVPAGLAGTKFTLIAYNGPLGGLGTFAGLNQGDHVVGLGLNDWKIDYADISPGVNGGTGTAFVTITAQVPEASAFLFGGLALALGGGARWWQRRRKA